MTVQQGEEPNPRPYLIASYVYEGELVAVVDPARPRMLRFGESACDLLREGFTSMAEADESFGALLVTRLLQAPERVAEFRIEQAVLVLVADHVRGGLHLAGWIPDPEERAMRPFVEYFADPEEARRAFIDVADDTANILRGSA